MNKLSPVPTYSGHWLFKSSMELTRNPLKFYEEKAKIYGDTFYARIPGGRFLLSSNPEFIKYNLQTNHKNYTKDRSYEQLALLLGNGLVTSRGEFWKKQRKIAQPMFYKKSLSALFESMVAEVEIYLEELKAKDGEIVDIAREMMALTAKVAMQSLFSKKLEGDLLDIYNCISYAQRYTTKLAMNPLAIPMGYITGEHREFKKQKVVMDKLIAGLIAERKTGNETHYDLLQLLMDTRYEDTGEPMEHQQLMDELITMFSAGHETSANGLAWAFYLLAQHPEIVERLRTEVDSVLGNKLPTFEDLRSLPYTLQVINESMRLYPPVWAVGRMAKEDDEFEGIEISKGMPIMNLIYPLHRNEKYYDKPSQFNPDNFSTENVKCRQRHHFIPFAIGPRMCIGNHFALMEMQLILAILIKRFDFGLLENQKIALEPLITLRPKYGIQMRVSQL